MLLSLSVALWRLPSIFESIAASLSGASSPTESMFSAMSAAAGIGASSEGGADANPTITAASGKELTPDEHERLMRQARAMSPMPLDGSALHSAEPKPIGMDAARALHENMQEQRQRAGTKAPPK